MNATKLTLIVLASLSITEIAAGISILGGPGTPDVYGSLTNDTISGYMSAWGQTFQTPDGLDTTLDSYTLYFSRVGGYDAVSFTTGIVEWDTLANQPTSGILLWNSASSVADQDMTAYVFNTGGLSLDATKTYLLAAIPEFSSSGAFSYIGSTTLDYPGTLFAASAPPGTDFASLTSARWFSQESHGFDLLYSATFSSPASVPDSSQGTVLIAALTLGAVLAYFRRDGARGRRES